MTPGESPLARGTRTHSGYLGGMLRAMAYALAPGGRKRPATGRSPTSLTGAPRLTRDEAGHPRCVACFLCAAACPSHCIQLEAGEVGPAGDRRREPMRFDLDLARCILCGFCVQACPEGAIEMQVGRALPLAPTPRMLVADRESLLTSPPVA